MKIQFKARYIDCVTHKECGWVYWDIFGRHFKIEYDNGDTTIETTSPSIDINDINIETIQIIIENKINKEW